MDASQSALVSSILSVAALTNGKVDLLVNLLTIFTTVLLTIIGGTFGFSLYKQKELRVKAEKDAQKINNLLSQVLKLHETVRKNTAGSNSYVKTAKNLIKHLNEEVDKLAPLIKDVQEKGQEASTSAEEIKKITGEIKRANQNLGTLSASGPSISGYEASDALSDYLNASPSGSVGSSLYSDYLKSLNRPR